MIEPPGKPGPSVFFSKPTKKDTYKWTGLSQLFVEGIGFLKGVEAAKLPLSVRGTGGRECRL